MAPDLFDKTREIHWNQNIFNRYIKSNFIQLIMLNWVILLALVILLKFLLFSNADKFPCFIRAKRKYWSLRLNLYLAAGALSETATEWRCAPPLWLHTAPRACKCNPQKTETLRKAPARYLSNKSPSLDTCQSDCVSNRWMLLRRLKKSKSWICEDRWCLCGWIMHVHECIKRCEKVYVWWVSESESNCEKHWWMKTWLQSGMHNNDGDCIGARFFFSLWAGPVGADAYSPIGFLILQKNQERFW